SPIRHCNLRRESIQRFLSRVFEGFSITVGLREIPTEKNLIQESALEVFRIVYVSDPRLLFLRVTFADWVEDSILKISPVNFVRGLTFQINKKLLKLNSGSPVELHSFINRLGKYKFELSKFDGSAMEELHSKFIKCFDEELKLGQRCVFQFPSESLCIVNKVEDMQQDVGVITFCQEIQNAVGNCRARVYNVMPKLMEEKKQLIDLIGNLRTSIIHFEDWYKYFGNYHQPEQGHVHEQLQLLMFPTSEVRSEIAQLYQDEGRKILTIKEEMKSRFQETLNTCLIFIQDMQNFLRCHQRVQQIRANGADVDPTTVVDIQEIRMLVSQILGFIIEMSPVLQSALDTFDVNRIRLCNEHPHYIQCYELLSINAFETNFETCKREFEKLEVRIYQKFSLIVSQQPEQVIKTDRANPISVTLFNFNNVLSSPIALQAYLINEPVAKSIIDGLPEKLETAGTLSQTDPNSPEGSESGGRKRRRRSDNVTPTSCRNPKYSSIHSSNLHLGVKQPGKFSGLSINTGLRAEHMTFSSDRTYFNIQLPLTITHVERKKYGQGKTGQKDNSENVTKEKFCFLFVAELPVRNQIVKVWTTSLPMIVTTHGSHNEKAWATIAWDNARPAVGRIGFEIQPTATWWQISEMLQGTFKAWVGVPLKTSHVEFIKNKLKVHIGHTFPNEISWGELCEDKMDDCEFSFWCWFYRAAMIVKGHFKEPWLNGYIEGFISWEAASALLIRSKSKPGTFLIRFSDSEPGSLSLVFLANDGKTYRMLPLEVYKNKSFEDCCVPFLEQLNVRERQRGKDVFRWVYPNICKKLAFEKFYNQPKDNIAKLKPHYVLVLCVVPTDKEAESSSETSDTSEVSDQTKNTTETTVPLTPTAVSVELPVGVESISGDR
ncbi:Signal transducer and transcription activator, partial [Orchesella cincta]